MAFFIAAAVCTVLCLVHRRLRSTQTQEALENRHSGRSILSPKYVARVSAGALACYAAIAFTSDPAYTWLASVALMVYFAGLLVDRLCASWMTIRKKREESPQPHRRLRIKDRGHKAQKESEFEVDDQQFEERHDDLVPEDIAPNIANIVGLLANIVMIAAFVDLFILLGVEFFEVVIPHYLMQVMP